MNNVSLVVTVDNVSASYPNAASLSLPGLSDGVHAVAVHAVDAAGNADDSPWLRTVVVVSQAPTVRFVAGAEPPAVTNGSTVSFTVVASTTVNVAGLLDHMTVSTTASYHGSTTAAVTVYNLSTNGSTSEVAVALSSLTTGLYHVTAVASDRVGNVGPVGATATVIVDQVAPTAVCQHPATAYVNSSTLAVSALASDDLTNATWLVRVGASSWRTPPGDATAVVFADLDDGVYSFQCAAVDGAGNFQSPPYDAWIVTVDTVAPTLAFTATPDRYTHLTTATVCANATDRSPVTTAVSLYRHGIAVPNGASAVGAAGCVTVDTTADGNYSVVVTATDAAGNVAAPLSLWWIVDTMAPAHDDVVLDAGCHSVGNTTVCNTTTVYAVAVSCEATAVPSQAPCHVEWRLLSLQRTLASIACGGSSVQATVPSATTVQVVANWTAAVAAVVVPSPLSFDGQFELQTRAVDAAGNVGALLSHVWWLDTSAPQSPAIVDPPAVVTFTATTTFKLQLADDSSPGQSAFWYTLTPPVSGSGGALTQVPQLPSPNNALVSLTIATDQKDVSYTLKVWTVDQGGTMSSTPTVFSWTVASTGTIVEQLLWLVLLSWLVLLWLVLL